MMSASSLANAVTEHTKTFTGQLLQPTDVGYEEARKVHNGLVDKRPALIARCRGVADIVEAVHLARTLNLEVAVRGGGHNVAGRATVDGGLMLDLSLMKGIHVIRKRGPPGRRAASPGASSTARPSYMGSPLPEGSCRVLGLRVSHSAAVSGG